MRTLASAAASLAAACRRVVAPGNYSMNANPSGNLVRIEPPLSEELTERLIHFWHTIFETSFEGLRSALVGAENSENRDILYLSLENEELVGTCHLTFPKSNPSLGGLGEVATDPRFRGRGTASTLCAQAVQDFREAGGKALFLGTTNPAAAQVYRRLGWQKLAGTNVMANVLSGDSPEAFLVDYFREPGSATVGTATPADRIPMIPLLISPHNWQVLDANVGMFSTRYVVQNSCMGLYPRYEKLFQSGRAAWFGAHTSQGRLVGLSTVRLDGSHRAQVDGFTHLNYLPAWKDLIQRAIDWAATRAATGCWTCVSAEDEDKLSLFEPLGFREVGRGDRFNLDGRPVTSLRLERVLL